MARKKQENKLVCEKCGAVPPIDEEKSNSNWKVYKTECDKCGGKAKFIF